MPSLQARLRPRLFFEDAGREPSYEVLYERDLAARGRTRISEIVAAVYDRRLSRIKEIRPINALGPLLERSRRFLLGRRLRGKISPREAVLWLSCSFFDAL